MTRTIRLLLLVAVMVGLVVTVAFAESHILKLKDGRILKGEFVNATGGSVFFRVAGELEAQRFPIDEILSVVFSTASIQVVSKKPDPVTVPAGTVIRISLSEQLSTAQATAGERFFATLSADLIVNGETIVPAGKRVTGRIRKVVRPKRSIDKAAIEVILTSVPVAGKDIPIITDFCGVTNDGHGNASVTGTARVIGLSASELRDGKHVLLRGGTGIEFRLTQPMIIR